MPIYSFENIKTGKEYTEQMSMSELDSYLKKYGTEATSQEVMQTVNSFITNSNKALKERKTK